MCGDSCRNRGGGRRGDCFSKRGEEERGKKRSSNAFDLQTHRGKNTLEVRKSKEGTKRKIEIFHFSCGKREKERGDLTGQGRQVLGGWILRCGSRLIKKKIAYLR